MKLVAWTAVQSFQAAGAVRLLVGQRGSCIAAPYLALELHHVALHILGGLQQAPIIIAKVFVPDAGITRSFLRASSVRPCRFNRRHYHLSPGQRSQQLALRSLLASG